MIWRGVSRREAMTSLAKPWAARSTILARMTSRYGDVYLRALSASSLRSAPVNSTTYGLGRGIGTSVRECARPERCNATKIRHRIYEQEYLGRDTTKFRGLRTVRSDLSPRNFEAGRRTERQS